MAWFGKKKAQTPPEEENFISHLTELRDRVIRSLLVILILFGACFYVAPELMKFLAQPLQHALPPGSHAVFIAGEGAFFTLTKMSLLAAVLLSAQATDKSVNIVTRRLFPLAPTPQAMVELGLENITEAIRTIGLFRNKAKNLLAMSQILIDQHGGEDDAHDPAEPTEAAAAPQAQAALHVIGGAAAEDAIGAAHLEDLGERRLREGGRHAEQGHHPHPEQGPGAAQGHRERDPRDIAGSHASSQPDDEGLEARQAAALVARARNQMNRPGEQAHLDAARADRQVQAGAEQDPDEDLPGDELLECGQALREVGSCQNGQRSGHEGLHRSGVGRARQYRMPSPTARGVRQACSCSRRGAPPLPRRRGASVSGSFGNTGITGNTVPDAHMTPVTPSR